MKPEREARIKAWRAKLEAAEPNSPLGRLEASHRRAGLTDRCGHTAERDFENDLGGEILDLIGMIVSGGNMPPPEFLLTLLDDWRAYLNEDQTEVTKSQRPASLERHLIEQPHKSAGNYANRVQRKKESMQVVFDLHGDVAQRLSPLQRRDSRLYRQTFKQAAEDQNKDIENLERQWRRIYKSDN